MKKIVFLILIFAFMAAVFSSCAEEEISQEKPEGQVVPAPGSEADEDVSVSVQVDVNGENDLPIQETEAADTGEYIIEKVDEPAEDIQEEAIYVSVKGISLTEYSVKVRVGEATMPIVTMYPENASNKGEIWQSSDTNIATVNQYGNIKGVSAGSCTVKVMSEDNPEVFANVTVTVTGGSVTEPTYIDGILIVNKTYALPKDYNYGVSKDTENALWTMFNAAAEEGLRLFVDSGFRSYNDQNYIYNGYVARDGVAVADTYSARPGHSEHQSGLAFDINDCSLAFADTEEGKWLAENSYKYGFIIRYPKDKEDVTGYMYEPWHVRYLGVEKATEVYESGLCLEEFLGITSSYDDRP